MCVCVVIYTHSFFLAVHDGLQLLEVSELDLQLLHLRLHQQGHQRLDLPLLNGSEVLQDTQGSDRVMSLTGTSLSSAQQSAP